MICDLYVRIELQKDQGRQVGWNEKVLIGDSAPF
jgi:hypothetical protein